MKQEEFKRLQGVWGDVFADLMDLDLESPEMEVVNRVLNEIVPPLLDALESAQSRVAELEAEVAHLKERIFILPGLAQGQIKSIVNSQEMALEEMRKLKARSDEFWDKVTMSVYAESSEVQS